MDTKKAHVTIDQAKCAPCKQLTCIGVCPQGILELGKSRKPQVSDDAACTQCGVCADLCPTKAITVTRGKATK
jgi:NAD-dependent dihydropyrimidine dehydrogenase PreA subunit